MALFGFANIDKRINEKLIGKFCNISLLDSNDALVLAILDNTNHPFGEYEMNGEQRYTLTVNKQQYPALKRGDVLTANPLQYTPQELAAMPKTSFTLDAIEKDDGLMQVWWVQ